MKNPSSRTLEGTEHSAAADLDILSDAQALLDCSLDQEFRTSIAIAADHSEPLIRWLRRRHARQPDPAR